MKTKDENLCRLIPRNIQIEFPRKEENELVDERVF